MEQEKELMEAQGSAQETRQPEPVPREPEAPAAETAAHKLAAAIYACTAGSKVMPGKKLMLALPQGVSREEAEGLLASLGTPQAAPELEHIAAVRGKKDLYYYDESAMTRHFAELDSLLEDKDILNTIATVARSDCQLYPRPTQFSKLKAYPFYFTEDEILGAAARMEKDPQYADIGVATASNGGKGFYSTRFVSAGYAQALIEYAEVGQKDNP